MTQAIITFLLKNLGTIGKAFAVLFRTALQQELLIVIPIAVRSVHIIEADPSIVTSKDKFVSAFKLIGAELVNSQKDIKTSTINLAIEIAVQQLLANAKK